MQITCKSVVGGWQTCISSGNDEILVGPIFNSVQDLWSWQGRYIGVNRNVTA